MSPCEYAQHTDSETNKKINICKKHEHKDNDNNKKTNVQDIKFNSITNTESTQQNKYQNKKNQHSKDIHQTRKHTAIRICHEYQSPH